MCLICWGAWTTLWFKLFRMVWNIHFRFALFKGTPLNLNIMAVIIFFVKLFLLLIWCFIIVFVLIIIMISNTFFLSLWALSESAIFRLIFSKDSCAKFLGSKHLECPGQKCLDQNHTEIVGKHMQAQASSEGLQGETSSLLYKWPREGFFLEHHQN